MFLRRRKNLTHTTPSQCEDDNVLNVVAVSTTKEPHEEDDDPKYWGASQH